MSKFKKKKNVLPAVNTASLPDIVFMLLFFFMVTTVMRETDLLIEPPVLPQATEIKKLEHKSLVSTIYIGKSKDTRISGDIIQLNDKIATVSSVRSFIYSERAKHNEAEVPYMTTSIKADIESNVGTISDIKVELREIDALKISYSIGPGGDITKNLNR